MALTRVGSQTADWSYFTPFVIDQMPEFDDEGGYDEKFVRMYAVLCVDTGMS